MPVLVRSDGARFITRAYRELLSAKKFSLLKKEVTFLQRDQGNFVSLFPRGAGEEIEAIFSHEQGYLLGETVWHFFDQVDNLIYCERIESDTVVLVIVREGAVFLDAGLIPSQIVDELNTLFSDKTVYDVYVHGDVPLGRPGEEAEFTLPKASVNTWVSLDEAVFPQLPQLESLMLMSVSQALRQIHDTTTLSVRVILGVVIAALVGTMAWFWLKPSPKPLPQPVISTPTFVPKGPPPDPLAAYKTALVSPRPIDTLAAVAKNIRLLYSITGWSINSIQTSLTDLKVTLTPLNPAITATPLKQWADLHQVKVNFTTTNAELYLPISVANRPKVNNASLQPLLPLASQLQQAFQTIALPTEVRLGSIENKTNYQQIALTVSFQNVAPVYLLYLGRIVENWPVTLSSYSISVQDNLVSGSVNFSILGKGT